MTSVKQVKEVANALRKGRENHYYIKNYKDLSVADLLLVLEDENYHDQEVIIEALVSLDYWAIEEAIDIASEHFKKGELTPELSERRKKLNEFLREEK